MPFLAPWSGRALALLLFLLGITLALVGRSRRRGQLASPRCPGCRYDLTGISAMSGSAVAPESYRCAECGQSVATKDAFGVPARRWPWLVGGLALAIALPTFVIARRFHQFGPGYYLVYGPGYWLFPNKTLEEANVGGYRIAVTADRRDKDHVQTVRVTVGNAWRRKTIFECQDWSYHIAGTSPGETLPRPGTDLNANGIPDIILEGYSGGAHCCFSYYLLELPADPTKARLLSAEPFTSIRGARDLDGDGTIELETHDPVFDYWKQSYASSPANPVIYSPDASGMYVPSPRHMRAPLPSTAELSAAADAVRKQLLDQGPGNAFPELEDDAGLLSMLIRLTYSGHAPDAIAFLHRAWPSSVRGRTRYETDFLAALAGSGSAATLNALNQSLHLTPSPPATQPTPEENTCHCGQPLPTVVP